MVSDLLDVLESSRQLGFLGPGPVDVHIAHAERALAALDDLVPDGGACVDLGSGGGVPGLVLAVRRPAWRWVLLDAQLRRTDFLVGAVSRLGMADRVTVVRGRAEDIGREPDHRGRYDAVVARSFGPPSATAECAAPLLVVGGGLVVSEPPDADSFDDRRWPSEGMAELGLEPAGPPRQGWQTLVTRTAVSDRYPRADGRPAKRPIWV